MTFKKIKFVTDSVADIPEPLVKKWDIGVVPCFVNYGGESYADDGVELVREDYYNALPDMDETPKTAAMPPGIAQEAIENAFNDADHLVIVTTPAKLSGIYNAMRLGMAEIPQEQVTLIDSGQLSMGIGWQVIVGAEVAAETGDVEKTIQTVKQVKAQQEVYAGLYTLEFLRRSGRVGWATANIGALLQIKPVVRVEDGEIDPVSRVRTFKRVIDKLADLVRAQAPLEKVAILHVNNMDAHDQLTDLLSDILPEDTITGLIGPTLGTHIGPGAIGAAVLRKGWRDT